MANHARWHSRTSFITTTLMILVLVGAPLHVAAGMLAHGALFLPLCVMLIWLLGAPLVRLSLATGQSTAELTAGDAALGMQWLLRLCLVAGLFYTAARAGGWAFSIARGEALPPASRLRLNELSDFGGHWHGLGGTTALDAGALLAGLLVLVLILVGLRRRLAALAWLGGPLLALFCLLLLVALAAAFWLEGPSGLAALTTPMKLHALAEPRMWADAAGLALLAVGAQSGVIAAAGAGLPSRAEIGREARILLWGTAFFTALTGMAALMLLCAACMEQGLVPRPEHARAGVLALDLVPTLAELPGLRDKWLSGLPPALAPSALRVAMVWNVLVVVACCFGVACVLLGGRLVPVDWRSRQFWLGLVAATIAAAGLAASAQRGVGDWWWPLLGILPALLGLLRLSLARRAGAGLRISTIAFESSGPRLSAWHLWYALNFVRPALVAVVALAAVTHREHGLAMGGLAVGFGLMWAGTLTRPPRDRRTQRLAAVPAAVLLVLTTPVLAQSLEPEVIRTEDRMFDRLVALIDARERALLRTELEQALMSTTHRPVNTPLWRELVERKLALREDPKAEPAVRDLAGAQLADGMAVLMLVDTSADALALEYRVVVPSTSQAQQLIELFDEGRPRDRGAFVQNLRGIHGHLKGPSLGALIEQAEETDPSRLLAALVEDMRRAWGPNAPEARRIRTALMQTLLQGRTLLRPQPAMGVTVVVTLVLCAILLALSLLMGLGTVRQGTGLTSSRGSK